MVVGMQLSVCHVVLCSLTGVRPYAKNKVSTGGNKVVGELATF